MTRQVFILQPEPHPSRVRAAKACMEEPDGTRVRFSAAGKTRGQEEKYHAQIGDLSEQWTLHSRKWDQESMKRLCVDQFHRDTKDDPDLKDDWDEMAKIQMVPSIDGSGVVLLGFQTRRFSKILGSAFIEWLYALGAEVGVEWSEPRSSGH